MPYPGHDCGLFCSVSLHRCQQSDRRLAARDLGPTSIDSADHPAVPPLCGESVEKIPRQILAASN